MEIERLSQHIYNSIIYILISVNIIKGVNTKYPD